MVRFIKKLIDQMLYEWVIKNCCNFKLLDIKKGNLNNDFILISKIKQFHILIQYNMAFIKSNRIIVFYS